MIFSRFSAGFIFARAKLILLALWLCMPSLPVTAARTPTNLDASMHTRHFTVYYNSKADFQARLLAEIAEKELLRLSEDLNYIPDPDRPFPLRIYSSRRAFMAHEGIESRKWTVGTTRSITEAIAIDASGVLVEPGEVLAHEIAHAIIFRMLGPHIVKLPLWFNEGLAQVESKGEKDSSDRLITEAASSGTLLPLATLETSFPDKSVDLAYAVSSSALRYMIQEHGKSSPRIVLNELRRTGSFDKAMLKATGLTGEEFANAWYKDTTRRFWGLTVIKAVTAAVSAVMAGLAIAAFMARRRRMAAAAKSWEQEEFEEALRRQQGNDWSK